MEKEIRYPVDTANFRNIRENEFVYVDKTGYIDKLTRNMGKYYFLARPRRFGKSLFLDTLAEYFKGNRQLFKGLEIDRLQPREWEKYPVLRFNLSGISFLNENSLNDSLHYSLNSLQEWYEVNSTSEFPSTRFLEIITNIIKKHGKQVVILIDEYDAPLSSTIDRPELQAVYREQLHGFYSVLKMAEEHIRFCMLTGVTRYGKVSVFSGLNNLNDITFHNDYAAICGITTGELRHNYQLGVTKLAGKEGISTEDAFELLRFHYDGYHFSASLIDIYNPFSINYALYNCEIKDYWCESGVPTILALSLMENDYDIKSLVGMKVEEQELRDLSMYTANPVPLFYQTGYLTLKGYDDRRKRFTIGYPNREVEEGIIRNVLDFYVRGKRSSRNTVFDMEDAFMDGNPEQFVKLLTSFLSGIPSDLRRNVGRYENYYHTIFYCIATLIGLNVDAEYATSEGYIDLLVKTENYIYVIELKVNGTAEDAIRQIEEKGYCKPFEADSRKLFRIGIGFSKDTGTISGSEII